MRHRQGQENPGWRSLSFAAESWKRWRSVSKTQRNEQYDSGQAVSILNINMMITERKVMTKVLPEAVVKSIREEPRFRGIKPIKDRKRMPLSPGMYAERMIYMAGTLQSGMTDGSTDSLEQEMAGFIRRKYAIALSSGAAAMHMALRLAAEKIYGSVEDGSGKNNSGEGGILHGQRVFCSDLTSSAMANPVIYEGGEPVFIDVSAEDWGMDPDVLEIAFERYQDVKIVMMTHLYGFPGQIGRIKRICEKYGALLIEDASESLGAAIGGKQTGSFGNYSVLNFYDEDSMPEIEGGMLFVDELFEAEKVRSWISQSLVESSQKWYGVPGYNRGMGDITAGIIRDRMHCLNNYITKKKAIYECYQRSFQEDLMMLNPVGVGTEPSYRSPCMTVESSIGFIETRSKKEYGYISQHGTAAPMEILDALMAFGTEGKPVRKPMHMQPIFKNCDQISLDGSKKDYEGSEHSSLLARYNESADIFRKGICLPADIGMPEEEQERIIAVIFSCYSRRDLNREIWCGI